MLIKEYRIPLPLTVEEYRIAQLYMIAKKSREESSGAGSGVEILVNEPYENGPGGNGQYTRKIYHIGSHLPGWIKGLLPKSALTAEEEAWNTKTRYTCPFVKKFSLEIETYYFPHDGHQDNVFKLSGSDLRNRLVDVIDIVQEQTYTADYFSDEDPKLFVSEKTGRGPLADNWLTEHWNEVKGKTQPTAKNMSLMCAYKLCRVEFRYWGMQTKLEKFIHDTALRKTMFRAHRQAWAWQDEWHGMTMDDIRELERQTQLALQRKMGDGSVGEEDEDPSTSEAEQASKHSKQMSSIEKTDDTPMFPKKLQAPPKLKQQPPSTTSAESSDADDDEFVDNSVRTDRSDANQLSKSKYGSRGALHSPIGSTQSFDLQNWISKSNRLPSESWQGISSTSLYPTINYESTSYLPSELYGYDANYSNSNYTCAPIVMPLSNFLLMLLYAVVCIVGLMGNTLVIYVVLRLDIFVGNLIKIYRNDNTKRKVPAPMCVTWSRSTHAQNTIYDST